MKGLGKGLDTLIPTNLDTSILHDSEKIEKIPLAKIVTNPDQPRKYFDEEALQELARSIKRHGIVQPLVVIKSGNQYRIVAGERRFRAANKAGLNEVPAIVRSMKDLEELEIALIENVQRVDLSPLEQAISIQKLHDQFSLGYDAIAVRLGKATTTVHNIVRLLGLPDNAKEALSSGKITEGHARSILAVKEPSKQKELLNQIIKDKWSVRQAEQYVMAIKKDVVRKKPLNEHMASSNPLTEKLASQLKTKIAIKRTAKGGKLEVYFSNDQQLDNLVGILLNRSKN